MFYANYFAQTDRQSWRFPKPNVFQSTNNEEVGEILETFASNKDCMGLETKINRQYSVDLLNACVSVKHDICAINSEHYV